MWMRSRLFQKLGGGRLERIGIGIASWFQLLGLAGHKDRATLRLIRQVRRQRRSLILATEAYIVHSLARAAARLPGDIAEVGVYEGGSAKLICEVKGERSLHLFDTFEGLPESTEHDRAIHAKKQYACSVESVSGYLAQYPNVYFYRGLFPDSVPQAESRLSGARFSFVHFDVDLYESTLACLNYFYPRMNPGGVMLSHDYSILAGVQRAFEEFLADKPEGLIDLPTTQCMVIKAAL
jgi:O-methyltransferase